MHVVEKIKPCPHLYKAPQDQVYSIDVHYTPKTELMSKMNASFVAPSLPTNDDGQVVYFWPGFKSTDPTMGLPVLQPVLQYGTDCCGGGNYWCVRSWFVYGNQGIAYQSPEVAVTPGDLVTSYMSFDNKTQIWTINAYNTNSKLNSTLFISDADVLDTKFYVAMLVLETIMDQSVCADLPANGLIEFSNISVNGKQIQWTDRVTSHECGENIVDDSTTVTFRWNGTSNVALK